MRKSATTIVLIIATLVGCSGPGREKAILATLITVDAAKDAYVSFDLQHQQALVDNATTREDAEAKVAAWRKTQARIIELFKVAYDTMKAAAELDNDQSLATMQKALVDLIQAVADAKKAGSP